MYKVRPFGRDCWGNCSGYEVVEQGGRVVERFVANIYEPRSHTMAFKQAQSYALALNSANERRRSAGDLDVSWP